MLKSYFAKMGEPSAKWRWFLLLPSLLVGGLLAYALMDDVSGNEKKKVAFTVAIAIVFHLVGAKLDADEENEGKWSWDQKVAAVDLAFSFFGLFKR